MNIPEDADALEEDQTPEMQQEQLDRQRDWTRDASFLQKICGVRDEGGEEALDPERHSPQDPQQPKSP